MRSLMSSRFLADQIINEQMKKLDDIRDEVI